MFYKKLLAFSVMWYVSNILPSICFPNFNFQTIPLSRMDQWICSRLYSTVAQCEQAWESYELHVVTSALYSFWVHSLCDVYVVRTFTQHYQLSFCHQSKQILKQKIITFLSFLLSFLVSLFHFFSFWQESVKPLVAQKGDKGTNSTPELVAHSVLYHCISLSLSLLSPFMPFITEELWQRLQPFRPEAAAQNSLCLQPYPSSSQLVG